MGRSYAFADEMVKLCEWIWPGKHREGKKMVYPYALLKKSKLRRARIKRKKHRDNRK